MTEERAVDPFALRRDADTRGSTCRQSAAHVRSLADARRLGAGERCYNPPMADSPRTVFCSKLKKQLPGLDAAPWPGELGQRVYENISAEAWKLWEDRMKMILNEYRLLPWQKEAQDLMAKQMEEFLFGEGSALPPEYKPEQAK